MLEKVIVEKIEKFLQNQYDENNKELEYMYSKPDTFRQSDREPLELQNELIEKALGIIDSERKRVDKKTK